MCVLFVLSSCVVLFVHFGKEILISLCVCVSCGLHQPDLGILLLLSRCKPICLRSSEQVGHSGHGARVWQAYPQQSTVAWPPSRRRKSEL